MWGSEKKINRLQNQNRLNNLYVSYYEGPLKINFWWIMNFPLCIEVRNVSTQCVRLNADFSRRWFSYLDLFSGENSAILRVSQFLWFAGLLDMQEAEEVYPAPPPAPAPPWEPTPFFLGLQRPTICYLNTCFHHERPEMFT